MIQFPCVMTKYKDEILRSLQQLVAIESVAVPNCTIEGYPFGHKSAEAIAFMVDLANEMGMKTENCENFACHAQLGEGEDDYAAVLCHVDVVPVGDGWQSDPLVLTEKDGYLYGRGVADDKGAAIIALYCLKAMKDNGVPMKRPVRCIFGGGEEIGMDDMEHYFSRHPIPTVGFTPDADYPACHCEKGILHLVFAGKTDPSILSLSGGTAINCVIDNCTADVICSEATARSVCDAVAASGGKCSFTPDGNVMRFTSKGVSAHAMCPENGINAASLLLMALDECGVLSANSAEAFFAKKLCGSDRGEKLGVACSDEMSGELTLNIGTLSSSAGSSSMGIDIRYPATIDSASFIPVMTGAADAAGVSVEITGDNKPLYVPADHPLIKALGECYTEITGQPMVPMAMGGGTYARTLHGRGVAFGPVFHDAKPSNLHMPDENLSLEQFMLHAEICYRAMCRLAVLNCDHE